jgi:hypothetical protein
MAKLKVFRTPIGFHDAYVAAASQKAALAAWGADADLFARGLAEKVEDPDLTREPLSKPGQVIRLKRGTDAEHFAALPKRSTAPAVRTYEVEAPSNVRQINSPAKRRRPRPSRTAVERAETAIAQAEAVHRTVLQALEEKERALKEERKRLVSDHERTARKLTAARDTALSRYRQQIEKWAEEE